MYHLALGSNNTVGLYPFPFPDNSVTCKLVHRHIVFVFSSQNQKFTCCLHLSKAPASRNQVSSRNFRWVNVDNLRRDLFMCDGLHNLPGDVDAAAEQ